MTANLRSIRKLPEWVPDPVRLYLSHTNDGKSLRALARAEGCHASTVLRQVRRFENRRDDPLVDTALSRLGDALVRADDPKDKDENRMSAPLRSAPPVTAQAALQAEAPRILRRLAEPGALLAIAADMEKAVVMREGSDGKVHRTAVTDRHLAEVFALKGWISCVRSGRVASYGITSSGRAALRELLARAEAARVAQVTGNDPDTPPRGECTPTGDAVRKPRSYIIESPVSALARRRDRNGEPFLKPELVSAAERLREDFELAQMEPRTTQNWDRFLTGPQPTGGAASRMCNDQARSARDRVAAALRELGPGLGDMALRCCCYLEGLETAERRLGWSARSGKIVLRIALQRLRRHYADQGRQNDLIG